MVLRVNTLAELLHQRAEQNPNDIAIRTKVDGTWTDRTWSYVRDRADAIAAGILTARDGALELAHNDVIGILGQTSEDWVACDHAGLSIGLQTVPIYASLPAEEVGYAHVDTGIKLVVVDNADQLEKIRSMRDGFTFFDVDYTADQVQLEHIVVIDPTGIEPADDWESLADLEARGASKLDEMRPEMEKRRAEADPQETATYTYTSGTTGAPKAVIQTHRNHLAMVDAVEQAGVMNDRMREGGLFLFLPLAHSFGRLIQFSGPAQNMPLVISAVDTLADDARETRPGFFPAAPRVYEKMKSKIETTVSGAPPLRQKLFGFAIDTGKKTVPYRTTGKPLPPLLNLQYTLADRVVLSKLRALLGMDRAEALLSGSAPLDKEVHTFFQAIGLDLLEAYGLTETAPGLTSNQPGDMKIGTVGKALPGVTLKIADDKEILAKGDNITQGYLNRDEATADAFDEEGWFHTGDEGHLDEEGFLHITGRKKELIKTSGGKYVAPAKIEGSVKLLPIIQECVLIGDTRNYCTALISVDPEDLKDWAEQKGIPADENSPEVRKVIDDHVAEVNKDLASFETIKYWTLIPPLSVENGMMTASLKVKRNVVHDEYADQIDEMYQQKK
ncbi:AMP-dependent synthetase/ligase [Euzebya tangerina]|uniref:AMP-dependent synthetase/ligase n=1 Tax=Euzebya tangerina TaxID=591198 RepID=UPI000E322C90|nr:long-chain fatty acid--CoA ligase [Euzebya tangerina]